MVGLGESHTTVLSVEQDHLSVISENLNWANSAVFCSGWISGKGLALLREPLQLFVEDGGSASLITNECRKQNKRGAVLNADGPKKLIRKLCKAAPELSNLQYFLTPEGNQRVHSKLYFFESDSRYRVVIGSANLTKPGLTTSDELSVQIFGVTGDELHLRISSYLQNLIAGANSLKCP